MYYDDAVHICHSLTLFPGDPINTTALDDHAVVVIGGDTNASVAIIPNLRVNLNGYK